MTQFMFHQCAHKLGPGTSWFMASIAGMAKTLEQPLLSDSAFAVSCWNKLVSLRLGPLQKYRMIRNSQTLQLEGLVGNRQPYLNNHEVLERALNSCKAAHGTTCEFYGARLIGRSLTLWFRHTEPMLTLTVDGVTSAFYGGYYFNMQEASGAAIRGTLAIFSSHGVCLAPFKQFGARAARNQLGDKFNTRLERLFSRVFDGKFEHDAICAGVQAMPETSLGFDGSMPVDRRERHVAHVIKMLYSFGIPKDLAASVLSEVLYMGHDALNPTMQQISTMFAKRSLFDLFVTLLRRARTSRPSIREKMELLAYRVIAKRVVF